MDKNSLDNIELQDLATSSCTYELQSKGDFDPYKFNNLDEYNQYAVFENIKHFLNKNT